MQTPYLKNLSDLRKKKGTLFLIVLVIIIVLITVLSFGTLTIIALAMFAPGKAKSDEEKRDDINQKARSMYLKALKIIKDIKFKEDINIKIKDITENNKEACMFSKALFASYVWYLYIAYNNKLQINWARDTYAELSKITSEKGGDTITDEEAICSWFASKDDILEKLNPNPYNALYIIRYIMLIYMTNYIYISIDDDDIIKHFHNNIDSIDINNPATAFEQNNLERYLTGLKSAGISSDYSNEIVNMVTLLSKKDIIKKWYDPTIKIITTLEGSVNDFPIIPISGNIDDIKKENEKIIAQIQEIALLNILGSKKEELGKEELGKEEPKKEEPKKEEPKKEEPKKEESTKESIKLEKEKKNEGPKKLKVYKQRT